MLVAEGMNFDWARRMNAAQMRDYGCNKRWATANAPGKQGSEHGIAVGMELDLTCERYDLDHHR